MARLAAAIRSGGVAATLCTISVTVAADTCSQAGSYSTLAMLQGENAEAFLDGEGVRYWILR